MQPSPRARVLIPRRKAFAFAAEHPRRVARRLRLDIPESNSLEAWADHGVLLLNSALTVREGEANSHRAGWSGFTNAFVAAVNAKQEPVAFLLWGGTAIKKGRSIDRTRHIVLESSHPSPMSAERPCGRAMAFCVSKPFGRANKCLVERGMAPIDWLLV